MLGTHRKKSLPFTFVVAALLAGAWLVRGQQAPSGEKQKHAPGTIPAMLENPEIKGDIRIGFNSEFPTYQSLDALTDASDAVVRGRVLAFRSLPCNSMRFLCTEFRVEVEELLAGTIPGDQHRADSPAASTESPKNPPYQITVTQPGGAVIMNERRVVASVADQKMLVRGREYILFLRWVPPMRQTMWGTNTHLLAGGNQGAVELQDGQARSLLKDESHPVRMEVDRFLKNDRAVVLSHLEQRRLGRRP